jgi:hypothetical protein
MITNKAELLRQVSFGSRVAEEESTSLKNYFVETNEWKRVYGREVDVVYGPKGSGKSAIYALLQERATELFDDSILYIAAENPRGATAFRELVTDPPTSEREFQQLWKLYFSSLAAGVFNEYGLDTQGARGLSKALKERGLLVGKESLADKFKRTFDYVKKNIRPTSVEAGVKLDPTTGFPAGITAKVGFDPAETALQNKDESPDSLLRLANDALAECGFDLWFSVDRLDVAFQDNDALEANALRALFKVYLDMMAYENMRLMVFLRTDIWKRITESGFREASHITKALTITWTKESLLNLVLKRLLQSSPFIEAYSVDAERVLGDLGVQQLLFYRVFPGQIDIGEKKPDTLDWILGRTHDGTGHNAPRELIHLLNESREIQLQKFSIGGEQPEGENLFTRSTIKEALKPVSKVRLEQTLYAEYPNLKEYIQKLEKEKATQRLGTLSRVWGCTGEEAERIADKLSEVGFFEKRGTKQVPVYWVPFLYRDALNLVQGEAE